MFVIGTHIVVKRSVYTHHGVYIGSGRVVEYGGSSRMGKKAIVRIIKMDEFSNGNKVYEYDCEKLLIGKRYRGFEIVYRAKSRLGENEYNLLFNNCEHFANWCTHGDEFSIQTSGTVELSGRRENYTMAGGLTIKDFLNIIKKK